MPAARCRFRALARCLPVRLRIEFVQLHSLLQIRTTHQNLFTPFVTVILLVGDQLPERAPVGVILAIGSAENDVDAEKSR